MSTYIKGSVSALLRGSAIAVVSAFALASCSAPTAEGTKAAAAKPAAEAAVSKTAEPETAGSAKRLRLLSQDQYLNTLAYVFGPDVRPDAYFPPAQRTDGLLSLGAAKAGVTPTRMEVYQKAAQTVSALIVDPKRRDFVITCKPADEKKSDRACATKVVTEIGRLMSRRPLTADKRDAFVAQAVSAADKLNDFYAGLGVALEAMLVSPNVLFVTERSEADPKNPGQQRLDAYSLATRLSLFLWNAAPDDQLLKAAETGEIQTPKGLAKQVERMLASARLDQGVRAFFDDMYAFDTFNALSKDTAVYPTFTGQALQDAREETLRVVVDHLIRQNGDYRDLFTTRETFISPALAAIYKLPAPPAWTRYEFPEGSQRAGIVTHISFLASHSHPARTSATLRGKALRELLLCQPVPAPPANVDFSAVENPRPGLRTTRDRVGFHLENPVCAGCHKIMDPMGLALENFDSAGTFRLTEKGALIDASGTLDGKAFKDVIGLGQALHDHPAATSCLVKRAYSYATGSPTTNTDRPLLAYFNTRFSEDGYRVPDLMRTIALSSAFSHVNDGTQTAPGKTADASSKSASASN
ncbi:MAG: DUF1592 domain-containing protein [Rhodospirillaceae bacterium]|nr:DUF1592 domain-containing protein [Rhodospirillaceae bacterium]